MKESFGAEDKVPKDSLRFRRERGTSIAGSRALERRREIEERLAKSRLSERPETGGSGSDKSV